MKIFINCLVLLCSTLVAASASAQALLRTENGIVDLLTEQQQEEETDFYEKQLNVFRLAGPSDTGVRNQILSLKSSGPTIVIEDENRNRIDLIKSYMVEKKWGKALAEVNDGLALNPNNPGLLRIAAFLNTILEDFYMANYYYERYMEINSDDLNALTNWAGIMLRRFQFERADELLDKAMEIDTDYMPAKFYKTIIAIASNDRGGDADYWMQALLGTKKNVVSWIATDTENYENILGPKGLEQLCELTIGSGTASRLDELSKAFQDYYDLPPDEIDSRFEKLTVMENLGVEGIAVPMERALLYLKKGNADRALAIAGALAAEHDHNSIVMANYGYMLLEDGQYSKAEAALRQSLQTGDLVQARLWLASALIMLERSDEGWELIWKVVDKHPGFVLQWLDADTAYIRAVTNDLRYGPLCNKLGLPPESR